MTAADGILVIIGAGVVAYTVLGGADFGGGVWDLLAKDKRQRDLIASTMGPVWEANHVWLVFVLIGLFSGFPVAFGQLARMLTVPLAIALLGIVMRGAAFVFRQYGEPSEMTTSWGRVFAMASVLAPASLGYCAGSLAIGRVGGWFPVASAGLALACCAYLAAVFLCREAVVRAEPRLAADFRRRALASAIVTGVLAVGALPVLAHDAPDLAADLIAPPLGVSVVAGIGTIVALLRHRYRTARVFAATAVAAVVAGWGLAQYPVLVPPDLTLTEAAAPAQTLPVTLGVLIGGFAVTLPAVAFLFRVFGHPEPD
ncbi:cytochrome d ubiquinol oxidase subunit II [Virgisporangium aurantiacum]|uniref:Cytochrome D ubiquinol oxidase subunit II n=1 Tax=Virgisporangium aurantiacum TaxID=175570 RepID=A0A8J4E2G3_9ACTN|nr:cytochrome d ubiquinol oxidase subunit II [Virgisporangium aurantiacum]GIJ58959.1 cytochrome D ubiquinol oxidase subunit II [Virgisporangium aurantiacum]